MDDPANLLDYIREHPADLAARLVYADWLEERGEADLAEMARLGLELRGLGVSDNRWGPLEKRYRELLERTTEREATHPAIASVDWYCVFGVYSGILDELRLGSDEAVRAFLPVANATLRRHPGLVLSVCGRIDAAGGVRPCSGKAVGELLAAPFVARLRHFHFEALPDTTRVAQALAEAPLSHLRTLHLDLGANHPTDEAAFALAGSPHLAGLVRLNVAGGVFSAQGRAALRAAFGLRVVGLPPE